MELGVIIGLNDHLEQKLAQLAELGFSSCQLSCWETARYTDEVAAWVLELLARYGIHLSTVWCGWSGPKQWNFTEGPLTLGLVPEQYREVRVQELLAGSDFARKLGAEQIATHVGFIPEDPNSELYKGTVEAVRTVAARCRENGQYFLFETGQETPTTLLRMISDVGLDNMGVNLDPANLILYGKANPVDALGVIGRYVRDVHAKDGCYPTDGRALGRETALGEGQVNFPALIAGLRALGYDGAITIEREISGEQQIADICLARQQLLACMERQPAHKHHKQPQCT